MKPLFTFIAILALLSSCGQDTPTQLKEAWDRVNDPNNLQSMADTHAYTTSFRNLPTKGGLSAPLWSGDYWPSNKGGISYRWFSRSREDQRYSYPLLSKENLERYQDLRFLSPAEKYDLFLGRYDYPLTRKERERTGILKTVRGHPHYHPRHRIPYWEGLCHAWAVATIAYPPPRPITIESVDGIEIPFGASDIKALLTAYLHYHDDYHGTKILGSRCEVDAGGLNNRYPDSHRRRDDYRLNSPRCRDVNAGAFHIILTNEIGIKKESFIVDISRDAEVWNQAVTKYTTNIDGYRHGTSRRSSPEAVREVVVTTTMEYVSEVRHRWEGGIDPNGTETAIYRYTLELDQEGKIVGGEWISRDRPDFLWKRKTPIGFAGDFHGLEELFQQYTQDPS